MPTIHIADNIRKHRERLGLSKEELGRRVGVSGVTIGYWEKGNTTPRMDKVEKLAEVFEIEWDQLIVSEPVRDIRDVIDAIPDLDPQRRRALEMIMNVSDEDIKLLLTIMERTLKSE